MEEFIFKKFWMNLPSVALPTVYILHPISSFYTWKKKLQYFSPLSDKIISYTATLHLHSCLWHFIIIKNYTHDEHPLSDATKRDKQHFANHLFQVQYFYKKTQEGNKQHFDSVLNMAQRLKNEDVRVGRGLEHVSVLYTWCYKNLTTTTDLRNVRK